MKSDPGEIIERFKNIHHWSEAQWAPLPELAEAHKKYQEWLAKGYQGEMTYLERHSPLKTSPRQLLNEARSAIVIAKPYVPAFAPHSQLPSLRIAAYARNWDYHEVFQSELESLAKALAEIFPNLIFRCGTDTLPLLEREVARQAGLGWLGKNTCLIHPQEGSFFLIGTILLNQDAPETEKTLVSDFCGTCRRCIDACPTQALGDGENIRTLDARRCISYWNIEAKSAPPADLSRNFGDWFFGCDICQTICPWNEKAFRAVKKNTSEKPPQDSVLTNWTQAMEQRPLRKLSQQDSEAQWQDLIFCLTLSENEFRQIFKRTPLERRKRHGLIRNAVRVIENLAAAQIPISNNNREKLETALSNLPPTHQEVAIPELLAQIRRLPTF